MSHTNSFELSNGYEVDVQSFTSNLIPIHENFGSKDVKYCVYIPSKGRALTHTTYNLLKNNGIDDVYLVVEPQDYKDYAKTIPQGNLIALPENDRGITYARNFIKNFSRTYKENKFWMIDDDFKSFRIRKDNKNIKVNPSSALGLVEYVTDHYSNIGISSCTHVAYAFSKKQEVAINRFTYGCILVDNDLDVKWRDGVMEDLDFSLQTLESKFWCTLAFNHVVFDTPSTGKQAGGNMMNQFAEDNRLKTYEKTCEMWPGRFKVVKTDNSRGWTLRHTRRFWNDYRQIPLL